MRPLLIADRDIHARQQMAEFFSRGGYPLAGADSVVEALRVILKRNPQVMLLGDLDPLPLVQVVPLLRKFSPDLAIILVTDDPSLPEMRKFRREGIFYHALRPVDAAGMEELLQAVHCAYEKSRSPEEVPAWRATRLHSLTLNPN